MSIESLKIINALLRYNLESKLPKGTNFNEIDLKQLQIIQEKLNNRPRKILGYKTPKEMMDIELKIVA